MRGFSLVELMFAIAITAMLAAIAIPQYKKVLDGDITANTTSLHSHEPVSCYGYIVDGHCQNSRQNVTANRVR